MNQTQFTDLVRQILTAVGGYAVTQGYLSDNQDNALVGGAIVVASIIFGLWERRKAGIVKSAVKIISDDPSKSPSDLTEK